MAKIPEKIPIGKAIDEDTFVITLSYEADPNPYDFSKLPGVIYYCDEPRQILDALPGWLRRVVVGYGRFLLKRKAE